ncbi:MAG: hypothetical protein ACP5NF_09610 [Thermoanaerobaculum sp.]
MGLAATLKTEPSTPRLRAYAVICDGGQAAFVAVLKLFHPPSPGLRFEAFGCLWEVVRPATVTRGAVAKPAARDARVAPWTAP